MFLCAIRYFIVSVRTVRITCAFAHTMDGLHMIHRQLLAKI